MAILPAELLIKILLQIHPIDRMECMLVCRHWKETIESYALYHTVVLASESALEGVVDKLEQEPQIADLVRELVIRCKDHGQIVMSQLLPMFNNLRYLYCATECFCFDVNGPSYPFHETIEKLVDYENGGPYGFIMLSSGICRNLSMLETHLTENNIVIPLLKNAPNLKYLELLDGAVNFDDLNKIHEGNPHLTTLKLNDIDMINSGFEEITDDPATSLIQFTFNDIHTFCGELKADTATRRNLLIYISQKYPNLSWLDCSIYFGDINFQIQEGQMNLMTDGWAPLLDSLRNRPVGLYLEVSHNDQQVFELLGRYECQINYLKMDVNLPGPFLNVLQSQQIHWIETLVLSNTYFETFGWLKELDALRELNLSKPLGFGNRETEFGDIFCNVPSKLRSLTLGNCYYLTVSKGCVGPVQIESLTFHGTRFSGNIGNFIDRYFPTLSEFKLDHCQQCEIHWDMPNTNLRSFQLVHSLFNISTVFIKTHSNDESRIYILNKAHLPSSYTHLSYDCPYKSFPASERSETPDLILCFNSVRNLLL